MRAAVTMWTFLLAIAAVNTVLGGQSLLLLYPVNLLCYVGTGALAAHFARASGRPPRRVGRLGATAALFAWLMPALYYFAAVVVFGFVTLGVGWLGMIGWLICGPIDLLLHVIMGMVGAKSYRLVTRQVWRSEAAPAQ